MTDRRESKNHQLGSDLKFFISLWFIHSFIYITIIDNKTLFLDIHSCIFFIFLFTSPKYTMLTCDNSKGYITLYSSLLFLSKSGNSQSIFKLISIPETNPQFTIFDNVFYFLNSFIYQF